MVNSVALHFWAPLPIFFNVPILPTDSRTVIAANARRLLNCVVLVGVSSGNLASHSNVVGKNRIIKSCGYLSLLRQQNSTPVAS